MYSSPAPRLGDSNYVLLFKICQALNTKLGSTHPPLAHDTENNLLFKIAQIESASPKTHDSDNVLLFKIATALSASPRKLDGNYILFFKICTALNTAGSGTHAPKAHDTENNLRFKIAALANEP